MHRSFVGPDSPISMRNELKTLVCVSVSAVRRAPVIVMAAVGVSFGQPLRMGMGITLDRFVAIPFPCFERRDAGRELTGIEYLSFDQGSFERGQPLAVVDGIRITLFSCDVHFLDETGLELRPRQGLFCVVVGEGNGRGRPSRRSMGRLPLCI